MTGQTNLPEVLKSLRVSCDNVAYGFATLKNQPIIPDAQVLGTFREGEGVTVYATKEYFEKNGIAHEGPFAKLTIEVHTSLELVGLTAVLATKLAENNISANVVAAYFHDHIFVQYGLRKKAIDTVDHLKNSQVI